MKKLFKVLIIFIYLLITFFSIDIESNAASFAYADFNWEEFLKQNKNRWVDYCDEDDDDCYDVILATKEKFYKRLYQLLAEFEKKGFKIDDNIIIATVYYGLTPDSFSDDAYIDESKGYNIDESENNSKYIATDENDVVSAKEYFENETDTLKTLMNAMIGYSKVCFGVNSAFDNNGSLSCSAPNAELRNGKCVEKIKSIKTNYFDAIGFGFSSPSKKECKELAKDYESYELVEEGTEKKVDEEFYWDFLINNNYFDNKFQLQHFFSSILIETNHASMSELSNKEYETYEEEIISIRENIVERIKGILDSYGEFAVTPDSIGEEVSSNSYWWPIGGSVEEVNGIKMATGEPVSMSLTSKFGGRILNGNSEYHSGIDIGGSEGITPIIAAKGGTVVKSANGDVGTCVTGDTACGGTYGNYVIIQHSDGNYTLYAHLATNSVLVRSGQVVKQGQVIAYMGNTGRSFGAHLHFEVRVGENIYNAAQDPLNFVSKEDPRAVSNTNATMADWIALLEGGTRKGNNYIVENVGDDHKTFGPGITVEYNAAHIRAHGIDPSTLDYGSLIPINTGNAIFADVLESHVDSVKKKLSSNSITVDEEQLSALVSLEYNCGNINKFVTAYEKYGATSAICENWWNNFALHDAKGNYYSGLAKRRKAECDLFVNKKYNMNPYG